MEEKDATKDFDESIVSNSPLVGNSVLLEFRARENNFQLPEHDMRLNNQAVLDHLTGNGLFSHPDVFSLQQVMDPLPFIPDTHQGMKTQGITVLSEDAHAPLLCPRSLVHDGKILNECQSPLSWECPADVFLQNEIRQLSVPQPDQFINNFSREELIMLTENNHAMFMNLDIAETEPEDITHDE